MLQFPLTIKSPLSVKCEPKKRLRQPSRVYEARISSYVLPRLKKARNPSIRLGLKYEKEVHEHIKGIFGNSYKSGIVCEYLETKYGRRRFCEMDGLLIDKESQKGVIVEVKLSHTSDAYFQTEKLYLPIARKIWPKVKFRSLEVCRSFDPSMPFPVRTKVLFDLQNVFSFLSFDEDDAFGVYVYDPRR